MNDNHDSQKKLGSPLAPNRLAGFTLVEILVVMVIIASLVGLSLPFIQNALDRSRAVTCMANLKDIGSNLQLYRERNKGRWPREAGIRFLLLLHRDGMVEGKNCMVFICPGTDDINSTPEDPQPGAAYADWDDLDSYTISYAGRDAANYPVNKNREHEEIIASDDNEHGPNHKFATNYLYADGQTVGFDIDVDAREQGVELPDGVDYIEIGPDSPVERFQKLLVD